MNQLNITLVENEKALSVTQEISETLNNFMRSKI